MNKNPTKCTLYTKDLIIRKPTTRFCLRSCDQDLVYEPKCNFATLGELQYAMASFQ